MTGLDLLEEVQRIDILLLAKKVQRTEIEQDALVVDGVSNDKERVQTSNLSDRTAKNAVRLRTIDEEIASLEAKKSKYIEAIDRIAGKYSFVLKAKYIEGKSSTEIGGMIGRSSRQVRSTLRAGEMVLQNFDSFGKTSACKGK